MGIRVVWALLEETRNRPVTSSSITCGYDKEWQRYKDWNLALPQPSCLCVEGMWCSASHPSSCQQQPQLQWAAMKQTMCMPTTNKQTYVPSSTVKVRTNLANWPIFAIITRSLHAMNPARPRENLKPNHCPIQPWDACPNLFLIGNQTLPQICKPVLN